MTGETTVRFARLHHASFTHPVGAEEAARAWYVGTLGLVEVPKPETMNRATGAWFRSEPDHPGGEGGGIEIHAIPDPEFTPNRLGHPAILVDDLDALAARLRDHGAVVEPDDRFPGHRRFHAYDVFGNQLEFLQPIAAASPASAPATAAAASDSPPSTTPAGHASDQADEGTRA